MYILDVLFSISPIIGIALAVFILLKRDGIGNYRQAKYALIALVLIYATYVLDNFLVFKGHVYTWSGMPYLFYHTIGFLLYYFICEITSEKTNVKFWTKILIGISILRLCFMGYIYVDYPDVLNHIDTLKSESLWFWIVIDNLGVVLINLGLIVNAFQIFRNTPLVIKFGKKGELQYRWVNFMFITNITVMSLSLINVLLGSQDFYNIQISIQFDLIIYSLFFFVLVYSLMSFPVFAFTGHFKDLEEEVKEKYKKSSLQNSKAAFLIIDQLMKDETLYLDTTLKMNTIAEKTTLSLPHISQAINENAQMSFSDYINTFRIEEAKRKLLEAHPDKIIAIAYDVGFNSKATFYNAFKKNTNTTPTNYKKENKPSNTKSN